MIVSKPIAIDLFSGAGGLSLGFEKAGFEICQAVEQSPHSTATYKKNHPKTDIVNADICELDPGDCLRRIGLKAKDITIIVGGPPCQGFSESNRRTRTTDNPKNMLFLQFVRFLKAIRPAYFVIENVAGLRTLSNGLILQRIVKACSDLGYKTDYKELNSIDYGVPQFRRRIFIVGNRIGHNFLFPQAHNDHKHLNMVTVRQAICDLPKLSNGAVVDYLPYRLKGNSNLSKYQKMMRSNSTTRKVVQGNLVTRNSITIVERYKHIGQGQNWESIPASLMTGYKDHSRCHTGIYYRLEWDRPSKVIGNFRKNMLIHPEENRGLSIREAARLQSFPDDYIFLGSIGFQQQQVADAVPPMLAYALGKKIINNLRNIEITTDNLSRVTSKF
jgi:DNA (cytosine-5)-methyltransferase 1